MSADSVAALQALVAAQPRNGGHHARLAAALAAEGRIEAARDALLQGVAVLPQDAALHVRLASAHTHLGDSTRALASLRLAAQAMPIDAGTWREIGQGFAEHWRYDEAERALRLASALDPGLPATETLLGFVMQEQGDAEGAATAYRRAIARVPTDLGATLGERLLLPQVYADAADVARWRARYAEGLQRTLAEIGRFEPRASQVLQLNRHNFLLAYQGENDRELQAGYSALLARLLDLAAPQLREPRRPSFDGARRLRVGFVGAIFRDCTAGRYFERWITALDPARFERFVYHTASVSDAFTARIAAASENFAVTREGAADTARRILGDRLDVLIHPEVGMSSVSYLLAAMRLAPVQLAGWGHPVTTGSDAIDGYLTSGAMEPPDGGTHYTERLVPLPGLGVNYSMPSTAPPGPRSGAGLPDGKRIYLCAQSLFKVHPEMDAMLAAILREDPEGLVLFFQGGAAAVTGQFASRIQAALAAAGVSPRGQVKFLPRMESAAFRRFLGLADVVLDTPRWSGGNTSIDAFAAGVPVVTLPGRLMRGRQTTAMLQAMGLQELIARDEADYVRIAVAVACERERNRDLRQRIARERGVLFDRTEPVEALSEALLRLGAGVY